MHLTAGGGRDGVDARAAGGAAVAPWLDAGPDGRRWRALVVDDAPSVRAVLRAALEDVGLDVEDAASAEAALAAMARWDPDVMLLDVHLPGKTGFELLGELREVSDVPVIIVSGRDEEDVVVRGLDLGADDYLVKPVSTRELVARVRAVLRSRHAGLLVRVIEHGGLRVDLGARTATVDGRAVTLTAKEFDLLAVLAANRGRSFTRAELLQRVWASRLGWQDDATVTEHVRRLRRKLGDAAAAPRFVETVPGGAYRFCDSG